MLPCAKLLWPLLISRAQTVVAQMLIILNMNIQQVAGKLRQVVWIKKKTLFDEQVYW